MPKGFTMGICPTCGKPIYQLAKKASVNQPRRRAANKEAVTKKHGKPSHAEAALRMLKGGAA
jgi:hypothetical protein